MRATLCSDRASTAVTRLELPPAVFKTCPWQPRELVETGLRQWLRCCAAALRDDQVIGMPSHAVDEAWHGLILCTMRYQAFCAEAYGKFMHPGRLVQVRLRGSRCRVGVRSSAMSMAAVSPAEG